jgi:hypothetical protein
MPAARPDRPEPTHPGAARGIAEQSRSPYLVVQAKVLSCNRLGRIGNLPARSLGDWWRLSRNRRG